MADNVIIPAVGTGDTTPTVATDDVGGAHYQRVKIDGGGDGASEPITGTTAAGLTTNPSDRATRDNGKVDIAAFDVALPAGTNNIGDVDVASIAAGTNVIGATTVGAPTTAQAPSNDGSAAYEDDNVIKASAGILLSLNGYNSKTSAQFIQIHNVTSAPADTAVPIVTFLVEAQANFSIDYNPRGKAFDTGIYVCNSSTGPTKTIGSNDCWFNAEFV